MNQQLVKGEAFVRKSAQPTWNQALTSNLNAGLNQLAKINAVKKAEKNAINNKVSAYINRLNSDIDLTNLTDSQQQAVTNYLVQERNVYADAARQISKIEDTSSEEYLNLRDQMNGIQRSFGNLATQLNSFKEDKISYLKDFDDNRVSDGNEIGSLKKASRIYTDEGSMGIGPGGQVTFWDDDNLKYENYATIQKPFLKDFAAADSILQLNESLYNSGQTLSSARQNMVRNKLKNMINSGGRDTLLSLASDDFLIEGGLNLQDPSLFETENQDLLADAVLNSYMDALTNTSKQGARDKRPASSRGGGGYSGAVRDEINLGGPRAQEALQLSQKTSGDAASIARTANAMDPTDKNIKYKSRAEFYQEFIDGQELKDNEESQKEFTDTYGNSDVFRYDYSNPSQSWGISVDVNDPQSIYRFYIQNSDFGGKAENHFINNYPSNNNNSSGNNTNSGSLDNL